MAASALRLTLSCRWGINIVEGSAILARRGGRTGCGVSDSPEEAFGVHGVHAVVGFLPRRSRPFGPNSSSADAPVVRHSRLFLGRGRAASPVFTPTSGLPISHGISKDFFAFRRRPIPSTEGDGGNCCASQFPSKPSARVPSAAHRPVRERARTTAQENIEV